MSDTRLLFPTADASDAGRRTLLEPAPGGTAARRSTVLPRVEWRGDAPALTHGLQDRYEEVAPLGQGGMGEVVLLQDHDIQRKVALKRLPPGTPEGLVLRFVEEIRTVGALEHPNIVPLHDVGVDEQGRYFFLMKHLEGDTLESLIARLAAGDAATHARFPFPARVQVFQGVLNAVAYAHRQGVLHRDLKPANVMVGPFGEVTVMDWGLAKRVAAPLPAALPSVDCQSPPAPRPPVEAARPASLASPPGPQQTQAGTVMGTPLYMSPEQVRGENDTLDQRSDVHALGVLLHEWLYLDHYLAGRQTLEDIFDGVQHFTPEVFPMSPHPRQSTVPAELGWYVHRALQKDPARRYQSVDEMLLALRRVQEGSFDVQCQRTAIKRVFHGALGLVDRHPVPVIVGSTAVATVFLAALVRAAQSALGW
jgi:eukaryotic-like serine/threonine-protein kinase